MRPDEKSPDQDEIERRLLQLEHVKELIRDIQRDGGLTDPLIVRGGTLEVLEGNSRLAAYRYLSHDKDPEKWNLIKCTILPEETDEKLIFALLGQYHIKGKKDWQPYEQAGFLYRRFKKQGEDIDTLVQEIGLSKAKINQLIEAYEFMLQSGETEIGRWSYFFEYTRSRKIGKIRKDYSDFDTLIIKKIHSGEIEKAADVRDKLRVICEAPQKVVKRFVSGKSDFENAWNEALEAGGQDVYYKKLKQFRAWIVRDDVGQMLCSSNGKRRELVKYELNKLLPRVSNLRNRFQN